MSPRKPKPPSPKVLLKSASVSLLGFGIGAGWEINDAEQKAVQRFIAFLEDRRVLFRPLDHEIRQEVDISVDQIRSHCSDLIATLDGESPAVLAARGIRRACRTFLEEPRVHLNNPDQDRAGFF